MSSTALDGVHLCPECGQRLHDGRPSQYRWICRSPGCRIQYIIMGEKGQPDFIVYRKPRVEEG